MLNGYKNKQGRVGKRQGKRKNDGKMYGSKMKTNDYAGYEEIMKKKKNEI